MRSFEDNVKREFERNVERYQFLKWGQTAFENMRVVPPGTGIVHQVNLEYLARVAFAREIDGRTVAYPDSLVGTDSHTTMINGLGVLGWGVGGIEAEAAMLGQPISMLLPQVVGFELRGKLPEGATATDLVLTVTEMLRKKGVVGKFVEFCGAGLDRLSLPDRATIANMAPEYGATMGYFPVDAETIAYLRFTGRSEEACAIVERYHVEQGIFRTGDSPTPRFSDRLELDLGDVVPSLAGPKRPQDRVALTDASRSWSRSFEALAATRGRDATSVEVEKDGRSFDLEDGAVVIAAITSCTNTSNPAVMLAAGLLAKKAAARGLRRQAVGEDEPRAGLPGRDRVPRGVRAHEGAREARVLPRRLRLHDVHREQRSARSADRRRDQEERPRRSQRPQREPQLRGAREPTHARELPRLPSARGRVRDRGNDEPRPHEGRDRGGR